MAKPKVLLIGWDAADWKLIWPLIKKGHMPALKSIMDRGVYGNMSTMNPPFSPMLWTSVATGKTPDKHGVMGFIEVKDDLSGVRQVTVNSRKSRALWNIFHNQNLKSNVIGWWPSFPAEPINGVVVSDTFQNVNFDPKKLKPVSKEAIHPKTKYEELKDLRMFPWEITEAHILPFFPKASEINQEEDKKLMSFAKIMAENVSVHCATTQILRTTEWDFSAVYYDLIDHFCHAFMKFHPPRQKGIPKDRFEIYKDAIVGSYRFQDMMLARKLELIDDETTVIVMSDHGYESGNRRIMHLPKYPASPALEHRQFGIFVAAGPNIKKNQKVFGLGLIDVAPTILHLYGLPIGKDMDGKVALDIFEKVDSPNYISSWEDVKGDFGEYKSNTQDNILSDSEALQQLVDLGYIDQPEEKLEIAVLKTQSDLKHNLARVKIGKKDYDTAETILLELVEAKYPKYKEEDIKKDKNGKPLQTNFKAGDDVVNVIPYYIDLLSISITKKEFKKASTYLDELKKRDKTFEVNTYFSEAKILVGLGKINKALSLLEKAKDKKPNSEVWYQIGTIYRKLNKLEDAKHAFENALKFEVDSAKVQQAMAETLLRLGNAEEAADHALVAIELVKYFPEAHYTLGEALEKMGDLENAKLAYETATKLKPKKHVRAETAIENVEEKLSSDIQLKDKSTSKYRKDQIVVVSGLPRSGTSLMMQMLDRGGIDVLSDGKREADTSNPKGYYEFDPVMSINKDNSWLPKAKNKCVKVVAPLLKFLDPQFRYKVIFMNRDLTEIVKSQQKMIGKNPETLPVRLFDAYKKHLKNVDIWKEREPFVEMIYIDYKDVLESPETSIKKIEDFIGVDLKNDKMVQCIDKTLYRNRV
ncbi:alkaline phosphatase family protein [Winogradskyella sp. A3E31]|uniref:alkaline phosphatase family protein n=1 Tax=Winogradskyella sp. A3E31 TaxID=3349637 RepID=UPI00398A72DB